MQTQSKSLVNILELRKSADTRGVSRFNLGAQMKFSNGRWENVKTGQGISGFLLFKNTNQPNRNSAKMLGNTLNITPY